MPRGRKKKPESFDEELLVLDTQIADFTKKLQALKEKRKTRIKEEEENKDADKWDKIKNSGVSVDDILEYINKPKD